MCWQRYRYYDFFPRSTPKKPKGGINAQSKRGRVARPRFEVWERCFAERRV